MQFSNYFPKKKLRVLSVIIVAVLVIGGIFFWQAHQSGERSQNTKDELVATAQNTPPALDVDTDGDGLKNWEEALWGTNPDNPDTDGDGTNDAVEVKDGRDPTVPGPNDVLRSETSSTSTNATSTAVEYANLSAPDKAMRDFMSRLLSLQASGEWNAQSQETISNLYISEALKGFDPEKAIKTYTREDIIVSQDSSQAAIKNYGNAMGMVLKSFPSPDPGKTELDYFVKSRATEDPSLLAKIPQYVERYKNIISASLKVPVPESAVSTQLGFLNAFSALEFDASAMADGNTEPVISQAKIAWYTNNKEHDVFQNLENITAFFKAQNITYLSSDPGSIFSGFEVQSK